MSKAKVEKSMVGGRVVLKGGQSYKILDETNGYWICKGTQFLKGNPSIKEVLPPEKEPQEAEPAKGGTKKADTKPAEKKEKPEEPVPEQADGKE